MSPQNVPDAAGNLHYNCNRDEAVFGHPPIFHTTTFDVALRKLPLPPHCLAENYDSNSGVVQESLHRCLNVLLCRLCVA